MQIALLRQETECEETHKMGACVFQLGEQKWKILKDR